MYPAYDRSLLVEIMEIGPVVVSGLDQGWLIHQHDPSPSH